MNLGSIISGFRDVSCSKNSKSLISVLVGLCHDKTQQDELYNFSIHIWEEPSSILEEEEEDGDEGVGKEEREHPGLKDFWMANRQVALWIVAEKSYLTETENKHYSVLSY